MNIYLLSTCGKSRLKKKKVTTVLQGKEIQTHLLCNQLLIEVLTTAATEEYFT